MNKFVEDIKQYDSAPNHAAIEKIASYLNIAMKNRDSSLVAVSDPKELERVEKKWAQEKLRASAGEAREAVAFVARQMQGVRRKNRVTFYYLVAKKLGRLHLVPG